ncbi:MAG: hypothetical protein A2Y78_08430 [Acidobacteria bacterium RBG_13_68_16]|nr:MAG: hypothetical protein A2Y78_08430 [Acidobacteria bacterium RBG_13_68_16]
MKPTVLPTIHLNGTSRTTLQDNWKEVANAARALKSALINASPNGRDYYPQGENAIVPALVKHLALLDHLAEIEVFTSAMLDHLYD